MPISIDGLSHRQVKLLNIIWSYDTEQELRDWLKSLSSEQRQECEILLAMLTYAYVDRAVDELHEYKLAEQVIESIK